MQCWLDSCDLGPRSRRTYLSTLRVFYGWAVENGYCSADPTKCIAQPRVPRLVPRPISDADLTLALGCADRRMRAWLELAAYQGLRCCEIARLRREDVLETYDPPLLRVTGKGGHQRVLPLNAAVELSLRSYGLPRSGYVFRLASGRPLLADTVSSYIGRFLHGLGIDASAHSCRHWHASTVYARTRDLRLVQELLGHADPKTTSIYAASNPLASFHTVRDLAVDSDQPTDYAAPA